VHLPSPDGATLGGGLTWHVAIVPDDVEVKPCRAIPTMKASEFFGALRQVVEKGDHEEGGTPGSGKVGGEVRWVLPARAGGINGWGAIEYDLELLSITGKVKSSLSPLSYVKRLWDKREEDAKVLKAHGRPVRSTPQYPSLPTGGGGGGASVGAGVSGCRRASSSSGEVPSVRATLLAPAWTLKGWTEDSAGFVYWATTNISPVPPPPASPRSQQQQKLVSAYSSATATAVGAGGGTAVAAAASSLTPTPAWRQAFPRLASLPDGSANKVFFGTNLLRAAQGGCRGMYGLVDDGRELEMAAVHMFAHRYAIKRETPKDKLTYHAFCLVQWTLTPAGESGGGGGGGGGGVSVPFSTVVELAWYQGCSGYGSKANWFADKAVAKPTSLCKAMPAALVGPWDSRRSEIRCYDVPMATPEDMSEYLKRYTGANERFLVPVLVDSATVRLSHRSQADLAQYLLNYVGNDPSYHEESRNCQTLAADLVTQAHPHTPNHPSGHLSIHSFVYPSAPSSIRRDSYLPVTHCLTFTHCG